MRDGCDAIGEGGGDAAGEDPRDIAGEFCASVVEHRFAGFVRMRRVGTVMKKQRLIMDPVDDEQEPLPATQSPALGGLRNALLAQHKTAIVQLDPKEIDDAGLNDRMSKLRPEDKILADQIRDYGQLVPIIVSKSDNGRYEIVCGRRRVAACRSLNINVDAIVREYSEKEKLSAQAIENTGRAGYSYIELAIYASALEDKGFDRPSLAELLTTDQPAVSRLISVARSIPNEVVDWIGPAPDTGRRIWVKIASACKSDKQQANRLIKLAAKQSDDEMSEAEKFALVLGALKQKTEKKDPVKIHRGKTEIGTISRSAREITIKVSTQYSGADWIEDNLSTLFDLVDQESKK